MANSNGSVRLSNASVYEQMFKTRHRRAGRPRRAARADGDDVLFGSRDDHPLLVRVAERRAYAVVHEEQRERLRTVFDAELRVLRRRGVKAVAADAGVALKEDDGDAAH